jgi:hypothetical protein
MRTPKARAQSSCGPEALQDRLDNRPTSTQCFSTRRPLGENMRPEQVLRQPWCLLVLATLIVQGCAPGAEKREAPTASRWTSRAILEARGEVRQIEGKRVQIRYKEEPFSGFTVNFEQWPTYAYTDTRTFPPPSRVPMPGVKGDPRQGRELFMARTKAPCTGCHLIPGDDVWPAGSVGPDLSVIGDRRLPDQYLFDFISDARVFLPHTRMPPGGRGRPHHRLSSDAQGESPVRTAAGERPGAEPPHAPDRTCLLR